MWHWVTAAEQPLGPSCDTSLAVGAPLYSHLMTPPPLHLSGSVCCYRLLNSTSIVPCLATSGLKCFLNLEGDPVAVWAMLGTAKIKQFTDAIAPLCLVSKLATLQTIFEVEWSFFVSRPWALSWLLWHILSTLEILLYNSGFCSHAFSSYLVYSRHDYKSSVAFFMLSPFTHLCFTCHYWNNLFFSSNSCSFNTCRSHMNIMDKFKIFNIGHKWVKFLKLPENCLVTSSHRVHVMVTLL